MEGKIGNKSLGCGNVDLVIKYKIVITEFIRKYLDIFIWCRRCVIEWYYV